ncbi:MAG: potassium transporter Kup [Sphingobacteriales bacterium 17-39-43]|uniref:KUP/HAK/KT family potassium transporter n=1 Tax=Daejeonella sp. TaxID=2805397 RepID=UPI000BCBACAF|nr:KUP/HAK/KT family potassium transporter [Daejeonella sp.]OYZ33549.1 MAG: potassium transporter Kup [Sphingobacteriales bacterium 16-39-50]OZA24554.1 MAG: potassium transporter Kup [Sphingobacteriales bacterium 17-39-43]HQT22392.1 KUP/HAK/KT family potassium transporter [Daejeonella sp.]HQT56767.1 KUP/HAK/KT family potassium transporter [Daejeonella sp.]
MSNLKNLHKLSAAGLLISLGIIYGDIGTSPLYVFKAIVADRIITSDLILGGLSCIFWTLSLQTTIKYVIITLRADNKGEGGILSLFSLVKKKGKWLVIPAMIGGSALLADGMITPPITVSAAIEGLRIFYADIPTVPIVLVIISLLFLIQQFGTFIVGKAFGPIMFVWFTMMAVLGGFYLIQFPEILKAISPYYAYSLLSSNPNALFILGAVFLCTTGAEALYSDLGHCGRSNIRISWIYVKTCLLLNYFGQGVWLWQHQGSRLGPGDNPFFSIMPEWFLIAGISIATSAAIIASQAMISGSFTLISEAVRLNLWPKVKINYPSNQKGQLYVPSINILLWVGCIVVVLIFRESQNMEGAYGLAINLTFLMTTILVAVFLKRKKFPNYIIIIFVTIYGLIEIGFLVANMAKFLHGGWFTLLLASFLLSIMWAWFSARKIKNRFVKFVEVDSYYPILKELSEDESVPKYASQLVYLTSSNFNSEIESKIMYSILQKQPKRADVYWLVHVDVTDEPFTRDYKVEFLVPNKLIRIDFKLGFRVEQQINVLFRKVVEELVRNNEVDITSKYTSLNKYKIIGDFRFVVLEKVLSRSNVLSFIDKFIMDYYFILKKFSLSEERGFGLDISFVTIERVPLIISTQDNSELTRLELDHGEAS